MDWILVLNAVLVFAGVVGGGFLAYWCWLGLRYLVSDREQSALR